VTVKDALATAEVTEREIDFSRKLTSIDFLYIYCFGKNSK
jgi:hypothetical protein